jgi:hypothetical protein
MSSTAAVIKLITSHPPWVHPAFFIAWVVTRTLGPMWLIVGLVGHYATWWVGLLLCGLSLVTLGLARRPATAAREYGLAPGNRPNGRADRYIPSTRRMRRISPEARLRLTPGIDDPCCRDSGCPQASSCRQPRRVWCRGSRNREDRTVFPRGLRSAV